MRSRHHLLSFLLLLVAGFMPAQDQQKTSEPVLTDNQELKAITQRDQAVRQGPAKDEAPLHSTESDEDRRKLVRSIIDRGELRTGADYANAALVFQHGAKPEEYLLAHVLATVGAGMGNNLALWLSAATLDRYLQSIGKPQVYGTQFKRDPPGPFSMDPIDPGLLTDAVRKASGVPSLAEQQRTLIKLNQEFSARAGKP